MLSRGGAFGGLVGSSNAQWAVRRARPSLSDSKVLNTIASLSCILGEIIPDMVGVESHVSGFADPIRVNPRAGDQFLRSDATRISNRQRLPLHGLVDRPPGLDDGKAAFDKLFCFVGE